MSEFNDRTGERRLMNCGKYATIVEYFGSHNITVEFEDGKKVYNTFYQSFCKGTISYPKDTRLGECRKMKNGMYATIIRYGGASDIDVKFENGVIVYNRRYAHFIAGSLCPAFNGSNEFIRIGETRIMNCGKKATIIAYRKSSDIDIEFEDGVKVYNRSYWSFTQGEIAYPGFKYLYDRTGEQKLMNCGMFATIIRYGSAKDIDVKFENGYCVYNTTYKKFKEGIIQNPNINHDGETRVMLDGSVAVIIETLPNNYVTVKLDNTIILKKQYYPNFLNGTITTIRKKTKQEIDLKEQRLGERRLMSNGEYATIKIYNSASDIYVLFDGYTDLVHTRYERFRKGTVRNIHAYKKHIGEKYKTSCGLYATIIAINKWDDITVEFEDGERVEHLRYEHIQNGNIGHPKYTFIGLDKKTERLGQELLMNNGQLCTIVEYYSSNNITVKFEDGNILYNKNYWKFLDGNIANPNLVKGGQVGSFRIIKKIFTSRDKETQRVKAVLWQCKCEKCGEERLITPQMMLEHKC